MSDFYEGRPQDRRDNENTRRRSYDDDYDPVMRRFDARYDEEVWPHSGPGIFSFLLSLLGVFLSLTFLGAVVSNIGADFEFEVQTLTPLGATLLIGLLGSGLCFGIGLILGIIGCSQNRRKRVFAVLGVVFCSLGLLGACGLLGLGAMG